MKLPVSFNILRKIAAESRADCPDFHHVAVVMRGGVILAMECNRVGHHAEIRALEQLWPSDRQGVKVLSLRFTSSRQVLTSAKPCSECESYMRRYGVKKVVYSNEDGTLTTVKYLKGVKNDSLA